MRWKCFSSQQPARQQPVEKGRIRPLRREEKSAAVETANADAQRLGGWDEDGAAFRGYQFADRIVRWTRRVDEANRAGEAERRLAKMHDALRDRGRSIRRKYFLESAVTRSTRSSPTTAPSRHWRESREARQARRDARQGADDLDARAVEGVEEARGGQGVSARLAAVRALALYLDPDHAEMFGGGEG